MAEVPVRTSNISEHLTETARKLACKKAVICPDGSSFTFQELEEETDRLAYAFERIGITKGVRTIVMVRPSLPFFSITFALFRVGAIPVMIDPGMGKQRLVENLAKVEAGAFIGVPLAHLLRLLYPKKFKSVKVKVTVGRPHLWGGYTLAGLLSEPWRSYKPSFSSPNDMAAIFFTTGSTGPPKGVVYEHGMFDAQVHFLNDHFGYGEDDVDLAAFPLFALFDTVLGMTAVIPDMDPTRPAKADPAVIAQTIERHGCTTMYASPALLENLARYGRERGLRLPRLRRIITAGAPVRPALLEDLHSLLPDDALIHTPYGATEVLPVSDIHSREILEETRTISESGGGICVGKPLKGMQVKIIEITEEPLDSIANARELPSYEIGEICVKGPVVTKEYFRNPEATLKAKMKDYDGVSIWHRMGDVGYLDDRGQLWFCGRKSHRVVTEKGTLFTIPCEAIFNRHPRVRRSALVGVGPEGRKRPVIIVELHRGDRGLHKDELTAELLELAKSDARTESIETVLYHHSFPVDIRHNAKIFREKLAIWAAKQLGL
ncbi:MAG: fatty acid CoA ligase family protein [Syntrophales bacterium]|nr:fatty acid CoA ligase family protein [Syntrophales bacterium]